jgi:hypothetical protein
VVNLFVFAPSWYVLTACLNVMKKIRKAFLIKEYNKTSFSYWAKIASYFLL